MKFDTGGAAVAEAGAGESAINDLLSVGLETPETEVQEGGDTPTPEPETEVQDEPGTEVEEGEQPEPEGDEPDGGEEGEQQESEEEELNLAELETDFADSAYAKAAKHYSKQFGKELDPNDQADRAMLRELMERGQKISELQSKEPEAEAEEEESTEPGAEKPQPVKTPEQMLQDRLTGVRDYAKSSYNPVVAKEIVLPMMQKMVNFIWGKEKAAGIFEGRSDADLAELTEGFSAAMAMAIADAVPDIVRATPGAVEQRYPYLSEINEMAGKEKAINSILEATDDKGNPEFPGFDRLVESGAINRALASKELKDASFSKDPYKNREAKLKFAYKIARNERVDPKMLEKASQRGREQERDRQRRVAAGRNTSGSSNRGVATSGKSDFLTKLVSGGESKSAAMFKNVGRRTQE